MRIMLLLAAAAIFGAVQDMSDRASLPPGASPPARHGASLQALPVETPATEVCLGDIAPDFSYLGPDARWRRLRDLAAATPVLLIFGANDGVLRIVDGEREALLDLGVIPVAVVRSRLGVTRALVSRLDLRYTVLADPQGVIAAQFNAADPTNGQHLPAWFLLDTRRRVRGLGRRPLPLRGYAEIASDALGLPRKGVTVPAAK
ncbi:MAG: redoxin domain-containing protein [Candidatus Eiseniibacteriota bacterium]